MGNSFHMLPLFLVLILTLAPSHLANEIDTYCNSLNSVDTVNEIEQSYKCNGSWAKITVDSINIAHCKFHLKAESPRRIWATYRFSP